MSAFKSLSFGLTLRKECSRTVHILSESKIFIIFLQVALHACGVATDMVMGHCIQAGAAFVISPCCYGFIQNAIKFTFPKRFVPSQLCPMSLFGDSALFFPPTVVADLVVFNLDPCEYWCFCFLTFTPSLSFSSVAQFFTFVLTVCNTYRLNLLVLLLLSPPIITTVSIRHSQLYLPPYLDNRNTSSICNREVLHAEAVLGI